MVTFILPHLNREVSSIAILISFRGKKYKKNIGESIPVKYWSKSRKRAKTTTEFRYGNEINVVLDKWETAAIRAISYFKEYDNPPCSKDFINQLDLLFYKRDHKSEAELGLLDYITTVYIPRYSKVRSSITIKKYNTAVNKISEYETNTRTKIRFGDVDINFYNDFQKWFYDRGYSDNYFGTIIKIIKQVYREAKLVDKLHAQVEIGHKDFVTVVKNSDSIYLSERELLQIHRLDINEELLKQHFVNLGPNRISAKVEVLKIVKDRFLIGAYTGLRVSDFGRLSEMNIDGEFIRIKTTKKNVDTVIPVHPVIKEIFDSGFDPTKRISDQKTNDYIKVIAKIAGITEPVLINKHVAGTVRQMQIQKYKMVSTHTARRSFATNAYKAGIPTIAIMKITGHTKESTFLKYIKVSAEENACMLLNHPFFAS